MFLGVAGQAPRGAGSADGVQGDRGRDRRPHEQPRRAARQPQGGRQSGDAPDPALARRGPARTRYVIRE